MRARSPRQEVPKVSISQTEDPAMMTTFDREAHAFLVEGRHPDPFSVLAAPHFHLRGHPAPHVPSGRRGGRGAFAFGRAAGGAGSGFTPRPLRRRVRRTRTPAYVLRVTWAGGVVAGGGRPLCLSLADRRSGPVPAGEGTNLNLADVLGRPCRRALRAVTGVRFAVWAQARDACPWWENSRMGRAAPPHAPAPWRRHMGSLHSPRSGRLTLQVRDRGGRRDNPAGTRPIRWPATRHRGAAPHRLRGAGPDAVPLER